MLNKVTLIGNLGKDPEVRMLESGASVAKFSVATNENYRAKGSTEWKTETQWHDVVAWRFLAERVEKQLKKGSLVYIEGKLTHRKYEDANNVSRKITEIVASNIKLLEKKEFNDSFPNQEPSFATNNSSTPPATNAPNNNEAKVAPQIENEDDLPF